MEEIKIRQFAKLTLLLTAFAILIQGCSNSSEQSNEAPIRISRKDSPYDPQIPLTQKEVERFLQIVAALPNQKVPEFHSPETEIRSANLSAQELTKAFQGEIALRFDAARQAEAWEKNPRLQATFSHLEIDPVEFAVLTTRLSLAYSGFSLNDKLSFEQTGKQAEKIIAEMAEKIDKLDKLDDQYKNQMWQDTRNHFAEQLRSAVAMKSFSKFLSQIPKQSQQSIAAYQTQLVGLLPDPKETASVFKNFSNQPPSKIQPVNHQKPN